MTSTDLDSLDDVIEKVEEAESKEEVQNILEQGMESGAIDLPENVGVNEVMGEFELGEDIISDHSLERTAHTDFEISEEELEEREE